MCKVVKGDGVTADFLPKGDVFQQLGHGSNAVCGSVVEDVERCLGVDQQGRDCAVVAGEGHVSVHLKPRLVGAERPPTRRQTRG